MQFSVSNDSRLWVWYRVGMWALVHLIGSVVRFSAVEPKPLQPDGLEVGSFRWARARWREGYSLEEHRPREWLSSTFPKPPKESPQGWKPAIPNVRYKGHEWRIDTSVPKVEPRELNFPLGDDQPEVDLSQMGSLAALQKRLFSDMMENETESHPEGSFRWAREMHYQGWYLEELADGEWEEAVPYTDYGNKWRIDPRSKKGQPRSRDYFKEFDLAVGRESDA